MTQKNIATESEWKEIGEEAKNIHEKIINLSLRVQHFVPRNVTDHLKKTEKYLTQFRSEAEKEMFKRGGPKDIDVFFGPPKNKK